MPGADMGRDKTAEYAGPRRQCLQRDFPQGFVVVHEEQQMCHEKRHSADPAVRRLIRCKIACCQRHPECRRLPKGEGQTFARDGVDGAGSVPDQCYPPCCYPAQTGRCGKPAADPTNRFRVSEASAKLRKPYRKIIKT
jgi:hypothetical protein